MPGNQDTLDIFNEERNEAAARSLLAWVDKIDERMKSVSGINIAGKTGNAATMRQQSAEMAAGLQQIADMQKKLIDLENQLAAAKERGRSSGKAKTDDEIRSQVEAAEATRQRTAAIKDQVKYDQAETDSIVRKRIELKQLQAVYDRLSQTSGDTEALNNTKNQVKALSDELKKLEGDTGRFQRNVGNYSEALKPLEEEFKRVTAAMSGMQVKAQNLGARNPVGFDPNKNRVGGTTSLAGPGGQMVAVLNEDAEAYQKLAQQAGYLNTIIQKNEQGFTSVTQQVRFNERALISLREAGLEGSEAFAQLREQTVETAREMKEFQRQQKLLESELPALKALTLAAKGLGGAYAIGAGAAALFADGNEKVEKEMAKLIAIMTVLQGLGEAWELIQMRGAAAAAFNEAALKAAATAEEIFAAATETSTGALISLDAAMLLTGIGALIVGLGGLIYLLSNAGDKTKEYFEDQTKLNEALKDFYESIAKANELLDEELRKQDEVLKKAMEVFAINARTGKDQNNLAAMKKANAEQDKKTSDSVAESLKKELGITGDLKDAQDDLQGAYDESVQHVKALQDLTAEAQEKINFSKEHGGDEDPRLTTLIELDKARIKDYQAEGNAVKAKLDRIKVVTKAQEDAEQALKIIDAEEQKRQFENNQLRIAAIHEIAQETRRQTAEYLAMQADIGVSEQQRLKALNAEKAIREQMIIAERNQQLQAKNLNRGDLTETEEKERLAIIGSYNEKIFTLDVDFMGREAVMRKDFRDRDVNEANFTNEELLKKREEYFKQEEALAAQHAANQKAAIETDRDQRLKALDEQQARSHPAKEGPLGAQAYADRRLKIETEANNKSLEADKQLAKKQLAIAQQKEDELKRQPSRSPEEAKKQLQDIATLEEQKNALTAKYAALDKQQTLNTDNLERTLDEEKLARKKKIADQEVELAKNVEETVSAFVRGSYEAQLMHIERQIQKNNQLHEAETARIQNSTLQETAKAAQMEILQRQTSDRNAVLQRKEQQIKVKEAQFDRDKAILDITATTAAAVAKDIGIATALAADPVTAPLAANAYIQAAIAGAIGAAQIAAVLAKPIPKFEAGTEYSPEGLALLHPGEMRIDPSGKISMTSDAPESLTYLEKGTKIIPRHRHDEMNDILLASILGANAPAPGDNRLIDEVRGMRETIAQNGRDTVAAIKKQKPAHVDVHVDANFLTYIKNCL